MRDSLVALDSANAAPDDSSSDLQGIWEGTCSDDGKASEVRGEVCVRGTDEAREVSIWGGGYRLRELAAPGPLRLARQR